MPGLIIKGSLAYDLKEVHEASDGALVLELFYQPLNQWERQMIQLFLKTCGTVLMLAALTLTTGCGGGTAADGTGTGATGSAK